MALTSAGQAAPGRPAAPSRAVRWVIAGFALCVVYMALVHLVTLAGVPRYYQRVTQGQVPALALGASSEISNAYIAAEAASRGLTLSGYAVYSLAFNGLLAAAFWAAAALVLRRHGRDWYRWLMVTVLLLYPAGGLAIVSFIAFPGATGWLDAVSLLWPLLQVALYLFPTGRLPAPFWRWPMALTVGLHAVFQVLAYALLVGLVDAQAIDLAQLEPLFALDIAMAFVCIAACQVHRYRRAGPVERKQLQWFVAGMLFVAVGGGLINVVVEQWWPALYSNGYFADFDLAAGLVVPASITLAIVRYRLWDIDVIIRRTLIYSVLTGVLALAYLGSVLVLESVFRALTGRGQNSLVVVLSTLAIAALFVPLRARIQHAIDRRFYRRKYDAARTLAGFAASARDETDLTQLTERLVSVVDETMRPAHTSLWLRKVDP